ncbi:MAG: ubiquinol oxidase subunit II [Sphingomonadaceae bacterium]|nr:ubiquinol oxidase subunit II [Sphingomonadaceae bacterium]
MTVRSGISALAPVLLTGCAGAGVLDPQGPIGGAERLILYDSLGIMLAIVVPTMIATAAFAWWFRAGNTKAQYWPDWAYSGRLELIVWSIPILVIMFLGGVIWVGSHELDPYRPIASTAKPIEVQVVALDWKWLFIYPAENVATVNRLVVPAGVPIHFSITSASVMNGFFVPQLGSMMMAMNGMVTQLNLQADKPGSYYGQSSQFSGDGFSDMNFALQAVPPAQYSRWLTGVRGGGGTLDQTAYGMLLNQTLASPPAVFANVQPGLFDAIATRKLPDGSGPESGRGGKPQVSPGRPR